MLLQGQAGAGQGLGLSQAGDPKALEPCRQGRFAVLALLARLGQGLAAAGTDAQHHAAAHLQLLGFAKAQVRPGLKELARQGDRLVSPQQLHPGGHGPQAGVGIAPGLLQTLESRQGGPVDRCQGGQLGLQLAAGLLLALQLGQLGVQPGQVGLQPGLLHQPLQPLAPFGDRLALGLQAGALQLLLAPLLLELGQLDRGLLAAGFQLLGLLVQASQAGPQLAQVGQVAGEGVLAQLQRFELLLGQGQGCLQPGLFGGGGLELLLPLAQRRQALLLELLQAGGAAG